MHDQSEALQGVSALRARNKANVDTGSQSRRSVVLERDNSPLFYLLPLRFYGKTITKEDRALARARSNVHRGNHSKEESRKVKDGRLEGSRGAVHPDDLWNG